MGAETLEGGDMINGPPTALGEAQTPPRPAAAHPPSHSILFHPHFYSRPVPTALKTASFTRFDHKKKKKLQKSRRSQSSSAPQAAAPKVWFQSNSCSGRRTLFAAQGIPHSSLQRWRLNYDLPPQCKQQPDPQTWNAPSRNPMKRYSQTCYTHKCQKCESVPSPLERSIQKSTPEEGGFRFHQIVQQNPGLILNLFLQQLPKGDVHQKCKFSVLNVGKNTWKWAVQCGVFILFYCCCFFNW